MTAISKEWVTVADSAVDPDSPVDTTLMTGLRDNLVHLREWLGASFIAGAVQDHNHDGANSALVEIGPNLLRNGSWEDGSNGWTLTDYTGGSHAVQTTGAMHGKYCLAITSTSTANGGGYADSNEFLPCAPARNYSVQAFVKASAANISSKIEVIWYDSAQAQISISTIYTSTNTPTAATAADSSVTSPANTAYAKVRCTGGVPASGSATGTIYFDGAVFGGIDGVTQAVGTNNTKLATTAFCEAGFVNNDVGSIGIGSFVFAIHGTVNTAIVAGSTYAGSALYGGIRNNSGAIALVQLIGSGTWRAMTSCAAGATQYSGTTFQRIS